MSDAAPETTETEPEGGKSTTSSGATPAADEFKPITSQDDLNRVIDERLKRERAKYADYKDVKAKAAKLDEIEQANLSELEKANGRITAAERERDEARLAGLRFKTAVKYGISEEDADLFLTGADEETLAAQAKRLSDRAAELQQAEAERKKKNPTVPKEGTSTQTGTTTEEDDREFARNFFGGGS